MALPDEFRRFCLMFHQDIDLAAATMEEAIDDALAALNRKERAGLKAFLSESLAESDPVLEEIWASSPAEVLIVERSQIRVLFAATVKRL